MRPQSQSLIAEIKRAYQPQISSRPGLLDRRPLPQGPNEFCDPQCPARNVYSNSLFITTPAPMDFFRPAAPTMPRYIDPSLTDEQHLESVSQLLARAQLRPTPSEDASTTRKRLHLLLAHHQWLDDASWPFAGLLQAFEDAYVATHPGAISAPFDHAAAIDHIRVSGTSCALCADFKNRFLRLWGASSCHSNQLPSWLK